MLESTLENKCRLLAKKEGALFYKWVSPGQAGVPDRILIHKGQVVFVELKASKSNGLSPIQQLQHKRLRNNGVRPLVVSDLDTFAAVLSACGSGMATDSPAGNPDLPDGSG